MKKSFLVFLFLCSVFTISAQESEEIVSEDSYFGQHEVKLNGLYLVLGAFEVGYEYILNETSGLGIRGFLPYNDDIRDNVQYYISPYYRYYFGKKYAAGFFLEGFGMLNSAERDFDIFFVDDEDNYITDFALGIGAGGKWITKNGITGELSFGIGRNLFKSNETEFDVVSRVGITIGYRF